MGKRLNQGRVVYHNDLEESLIVNASKVIYQMYLKAKIGYEHDVRVEEYPFAREAIREAVYNAIAHNCYMYGTPIQIRDNPKETYDDLVRELSVSRSTIKRAMGNLVADGHIVRVGGKRHGHWEIND